MPDINGIVLTIISTCGGALIAGWFSRKDKKDDIVDTMQQRAMDELSRQDERIRSLEETRDKLRKTTIQLEKELLKMQRKNNDLQGENNELKQIIQSYKDEVEELTTKIEELKGEEYGSSNE